MQAHRHPPKPSHYRTATKGECRFCGEDIIKNGAKNLRARWHQICLTEYKLIYWPRETRRAIWRRDKGICASCGNRCNKKEWDLDHRRPLIEANGDLSFWKLDNCQTLCKECHKKKTAMECKQRADARRQINT